jgi:uncharacterized protein
MPYIDSSAWVKRYEREEGTDWVDDLWRQGRSLACSRLGLVEVVSAVVRRHSGRGVAGDVTQRVIGDVRTDFSEFLAVGLSNDVLDLAAEFAEVRRLRGADCVHLASAVRLGRVFGEQATMIASDADLLAAARAEGLAVLDPRTNPPLPGPPS